MIFDSVNTILLKKLPDILAKGGTFLIYVVDAIMGTGKTSAAINYMNTHPDRRYMFVTPYLEEAKRVVDGCDKAFSLKYRLPMSMNVYFG